MAWAMIMVRGERFKEPKLLPAARGVGFRDGGSRMLW
jgi:hypothetical protein